MKYGVEFLYNIHEGQRCLLLGNGLSLERLDLDRISPNITVIGMHRTWRQINPTYHVILRRREYFDEILRGDWIPAGMIITKRSMAGRLADKLPCDVVAVRSRGVLTREGEMTFDLRRGSAAVMCGQLALEVAVWMGFTTIYLVGFDLSGGHAFTDDPEPEHHLRARQLRIMTRAWLDVAKERPGIAVVNLAQASFTEIYQ